MEELNEKLNVLTDKEKESIELFRTFVNNTLKFRTKDTVSAAARARKAASALTKLMKTVRKEIQVKKLALVAERKEKRAVKITSL